MSNASLIPPNRDPTGLFRNLPFETRSWRQTIAESGLPDEAQTLVRTVVKKSRLMRFEKLEVVQELIAHFLDGQLAGNSYPQLVKTFGDPTVTATLIRRSKLRNRPIMFKIVQIFGWIVLGLVSVYLTIFAYFQSGKPTPTTDFLAEFNQSVLDTDEDDKAWPIYRPMWIKHGFSEGGGLDIKDLFVHTEERQYAGQIHPTHPDWPAAVARLEELSDLLAAFRAGAKRPRLGVELHGDVSNYSDEDFRALFPGRDRSDKDAGTWLGLDHLDDDVKETLDGAIINILLPHIQSFRQAARIFQVDTRLAIEQGDRDRAVENIETVLGLGRQASDSNTLVGSLVGFAVGSIGFNILEETLVNDPEFFDDHQLEQLQKTVEIVSIRDWIEIEGEHRFLLDIIQRIYSDNGKGDGRITSTGIRVLEQIHHSMQTSLEKNTPDEYKHVIKTAKHLAEPAALFVVASRKDTTDKLNEFMELYTAEFDKPYWESQPGQVESVDKFLSNSIRFIVLDRMLPAFIQVRNAMIRTMGRQQGVVAALAAHRYFLKYDEWPASFDQLSPEFVVEFPVDQINGNFVMIKARENGILIYSVGNDRDDDGGMLVIDKFGNQKPSASFIVGSKSDDDGDWILWPQLESENIDKE